MYLLCDTEYNDVRAGQHEPNRGPHNLLRIGLRAALMYAYIIGVRGLYSQAINCTKTVVEWQGSRPY